MTRFSLGSCEASLACHHARTSRPNGASSRAKQEIWPRKVHSWTSRRYTKPSRVIANLSVFMVEVSFVLGARMKPGGLGEGERGGCLRMATRSACQPFAWRATAGPSCIASRSRKCGGRVRAALSFLLTGKVVGYQRRHTSYRVRRGRYERNALANSGGGRVTPTSNLHLARQRTIRR